MYKRKTGMISVVLCIMIVTLLAFATALFDHLRLIQAKTEIDIEMEKASEVIMLGYEGEIFENYKLMAMGGKEKAEETLKKAMVFLTEKHTKGLNFGQYKLKNHSLTMGGKLSDKNALKNSILKKYEKYFVANSFEEIYKKINQLRKLDSYSKASKIYSKCIGDVAEMKPEYDDLCMKARSINRTYLQLAGISVKSVIDEIISLRKQIDSLQEDMGKIRDKIQELSNSGNEFENNEKLGDLEGELSDLEQKLKDTEEELKPKEELIDSINKRNLSIIESSDLIKSFLNRLDGKISSTRIEYNEFSMGKDEDVKDAKELIGDLLNKLEEARAAINEISNSLFEDAKSAEEQNTAMHESLNSNTAYNALNTVIDTYYFKPEDKNDINQIFGTPEKNESNKKLKNLFDLIWKAINGDLTPDFRGIAEVSPGENVYLASKNEGIDEEKEKAKKPKPTDEAELAGKSLKDNAESSENWQVGEEKFLLSSMFDKMVIASYALNTFSSYTFDESKKGDLFGGAEVEYLLTGSLNPAKNLKMTQLKIFSIRFCLNLIPILKYKSLEINSLSQLLASFTGGLGYPIIRGMVSLGWCGLESLADLNLINEGDGAVIIKKEEDIISTLTPDNINDTDHKINVEKDQDGKNKRNDGKLRLTYKDHLFIFLLLESEEETLLRIADLIAIKENCDTRDLYTAIKIDAEFEVNLFFKNAKLYFNKELDTDYEYRAPVISSY